MSTDQGQQPKPTRQELERQAAAFYADMRKPDSEWKSIIDLAPQLAEFDHLVHAGNPTDYENAYQVLESIGDRLLLWGYGARLAELRKKLVNNLKDLDEIVNRGNLGRAYLIIGKILQDKGTDDEGAVKCFERAFEDAQNFAIMSSDNPDEVKDALDKPGSQPGRLRDIYLKNSVHVKEAIKNVGIWSGRLSEAYGFIRRLDDCLRFLKKALYIADEINDTQHKGIWMGGLGWTYSYQGEREEEDNQNFEKANEYYENAIKNYEGAIEIAEAAHNDVEKGRNIGGLGRVCYCRKQYEQAIQHYLNALEIVREKDRWYEAVVSGNLASAYLKVKQFEQALAFCQEAQKIALEIGDNKGASIQSGRLGQIYEAWGEEQEAQGQIEQAQKYFELSIENYNQAKDALSDFRDKQRLNILQARLDTAAERVKSLSEKTGGSTS
ncbi:MAG: tetratricopeptide repeat protein [Anaerolineae bacterium]|nr:tetratricopeptide repeat protein [Anaerolineae bacterium]